MLAFKKPRVVRPPVALPFGFKLSRRRGRRPSQPVANRNGAVTVSSRSSLRADEAPVIDETASLQVSSSESQPDGSSEASTSSSESSSCADSEASPSSESGPEAPEAIATEFEGQDAVLHDLQQEQSLSNVPATTFFNTHVGILDVSLGPVRGKTASCFHCADAIRRGTARFSYSYDVKRPWRYVHGDCLVPFIAALKAERALEQAYFFADNYLANVENPLALRDLVSNIRSQLLSQSSPSASSSAPGPK